LGRVSIRVVTDRVPSSLDAERGDLEADGLALIIVARQFVVLGPIRTRERR
jgi:hypothetical protein